MKQTTRAFDKEQDLKNIKEKLIVVSLKIEVSMEGFAEAALNSVFLGSDEGVEHHPHGHVDVIIPATSHQKIDES